MQPTRGNGSNLSAPDDGVSALHLTSTLVGPDNVLAVVNGQRVHIGDKVADARVIAIKAGRIMLRRGVKTETLWVNATRVKSAADTNKKANP